MKQTNRAPSGRLASRIRWIGPLALILSAPALWAFTIEARTSAPAVAPAQMSGPETMHLAQGAVSAPPVRASFASEQADRGERLYERACQECHGDDLKGGLNGGAPLRGLAFEQKFTDGAPAAQLYFYLSGQMPPNAPGRYSERDYIDLMAYIMARNGFRPGAPLPSDVDAFYDLILVK